MSHYLRIIKESIAIGNKTKKIWSSTFSMKKQDIQP